MNRCHILEMVAAMFLLGANAAVGSESSLIKGAKGIVIYDQLCKKISGKIPVGIGLLDAAYSIMGGKTVEVPDGPQALAIWCNRYKEWWYETKTYSPPPDEIDYDTLKDIARVRVLEDICGALPLLDVARRNMWTISIYVGDGRIRKYMAKEEASFKEQRRDIDDDIVWCARMKNVMAPLIKEMNEAPLLRMKLPR